MEAERRHEALVAERGDTGKIWASMLKEAIKRRKPDFSEGAYGFRSFGNLLEEAQARGLLELGRDEKSGSFVSRGTSSGGRVESLAPVTEASAEVAAVEAVPVPVEPSEASVSEPVPKGPAKRRSRGKRKANDAVASAEFALTVMPESAVVPEAVVVVDTGPAPIQESAAQPMQQAVEAAPPVGQAPTASAPVAKKAAPRSRRPRKPKVPAEG